MNWNDLLSLKRFGDQTKRIRKEQVGSGERSDKIRTLQL